MLRLRPILLGQHPALLASAVIGRSDAQRGQQPVAFVVLKPGSTDNAASLTAWCKEAMAVYKVPEIRVVAALPMTATGKVKHGVAGKRHRLMSHNAKYIRQNRGTEVISDADARVIKKWAPYGLN